MGKRGRWIQDAIEYPGALTSTVKRRYGSEGFTGRGTIRTDVLHELSEEGGVTGKRARLALTLRKVNR